MKEDYKRNKWVAEFLKDHYTFITDAEAIENENHKVNDIVFTADTLVREMEVKTIKNKSLQDKKGNWNSWFSLGNENGIGGKLLCLPPSGSTDDFAYILNAEDYYNSLCNSKWSKMVDEKAYLVYLAQDGLLIYTPKQLREALMGYVYYKNASHGTSLTPYHNRLNPHWELKAIINLNKGKFIPCEVPKDIF